MDKKQLVIISAVMLSSLLSFNFVFAEDGTYNAFITNTGGTYIGTALVEGELITAVTWSGGQQIFDPGIQVVDGDASGLDSDGRPISIELEDYY